METESASGRKSWCSWSQRRQEEPSDDLRAHVLRRVCGSVSEHECAVPALRRGPNRGGRVTSVRDVAASGWTFHLLSQVVDRAIDQGRLADAERMMSRGVSELEEQLEEGVEVEPSAYPRCR